MYSLTSVKYPRYSYVRGLSLISHPRITSQRAKHFWWRTFVSTFLTRERICNHSFTILTDIRTWYVAFVDNGARDKCILAAANEIYVKDNCHIATTSVKFFSDGKRRKSLVATCADVFLARFAPPRVGTWSKLNRVSNSFSVQPRRWRIILYSIRNEIIISFDDAQVRYDRGKEFRVFDLQQFSRVATYLFPSLWDSV